MRRDLVSRVIATIVAVAVAIAVGPVLADAAGTQTTVKVKPRTGSPTTRFVVSFRAPDASSQGAFQIRYEVSASGQGNGCAQGEGTFATAPRKGALVKVVLSPGSARWCVGTYHGSVQELRGPQCARGMVCPEFVTVVRTIGRFHFTVRAGTRGADHTPPTFGGLQRAFACTPGPQRPGQTTPYTLSWNPATDNVTPRSAIVYDIYMASSAGGEDFSHPTWITPGGATSYRTPGLPSHGQVYFVVRARDEAGNEDTNRIERAGVDPCV